MCQIELKPAPVDTGIVFVREGVEIEAKIENLSSTLRSTVLGKDLVTVSTVEHLLSACFGLGVDNLYVHVEGPEVPIGDGSALTFVNLIDEAGVVSLEKKRPLFACKRFFSYREGESFALITPAPYFSVTVVVDYPNPIVGFQMAQYVEGKTDYRENIAPARTFAFKEEVEVLLSKNLAKGGSLENALIVGEDGYINEPRMPFEVAYHKLLDIMGDLSLAGMFMQGHIFAYKPGHRMNTNFVKALVHSEIMYKI